MVVMILIIVVTMMLTLVLKVLRVAMVMFINFPRVVLKALGAESLLRAESTEAIYSEVYRC